MFVGPCIRTGLQDDLTSVTFVMFIPSISLRPGGLSSHPPSRPQVEVLVASSLLSLEQEAMKDIAAAADENSLMQVKARYLGKNSELTARLKELGTLPPEERKAAGQAVNVSKKKLEELVAARAEYLRDHTDVGPALDLSLGGRHLPLGSVHPLRQIGQQIEDIFIGLGFSLEESPHVESEWYNFDALNMPDGHPARDMQDTFYVEGGTLLRTHTSAAQIHTMLRQPPPLRMICAGAVYRADDIDPTHSPMFHQVELLMVDHSVTFADLKGVLSAFAAEMFGPGLPLRFRASYFPFTEPSAEVDILCFKCRGHDPHCRVCKGTGWLEILGCGMVNPVVFQKLDRPSYVAPGIRGFAAGMGVERIAMLKLGITDMRLLFDNDIRFLRQF